MIKVNRGTPAGRSLQQRVLALLGSEPLTLTQLGSRTGYEFYQLQDCLRRLRAARRVEWAGTGWIRRANARPG